MSKILLFLHFILPSAFGFNLDECGVEVLKSVFACARPGDARKASKEGGDDILRLCLECEDQMKDEEKAKECRRSMAYSVVHYYPDYAGYFKGRCEPNKNGLTQYEPRIGAKNLVEEQRGPECNFLGTRYTQQIQGISLVDLGNGKMGCKEGGSLRICKGTIQCLRGMGKIEAGYHDVECLPDGDKCLKTAADCYRDTAVDDFIEQQKRQGLRVESPASGEKEATD